MRRRASSLFWRRLVFVLLLAFALPIPFSLITETNELTQAYAVSLPQSENVLMPKKVVVVLADGLRLSDLSPWETPNLWRMQTQGAIGVMNQNTLGAKNDVNSYLTIGAGTKASAPLTTAAAFRVDEHVPGEAHVVNGRALYQRNIGLLPRGSIVFPDLPQVTEQMTDKRYTIVPGLLGSAVEQLGGRTAVIGNSDLGSEVHRPAVLLAMNQDGTVDDGDLKAGLVVDPTRPYGLRNDVKALYKSYQKWRDQDQLLVLETGDSLRLQIAGNQIDSANAERLHRLAIQEVDQLVGLLLPDSGPSTLLAVLSPTKWQGTDTPPLSPVLMAGGTLIHGGLLTSGTTKRAGLIANYDLAPTFVQFLGGNPSQTAFLGQRATALYDRSLQQPGQTPYYKLSALTQQMLVPSQARSVMLRPWTNVWIGLSVLLLVAILFRRRLLRFLQPFATLLLIFPLAWLLVPLYTPQTVLTTVLFALAVTVAVFVVLQSLPDAKQRLVLLAGATALTLVVDVLLGAPLEKQALLSYDPIAGARYYGIGNEYMGVLLGALLLVLNLSFGQTTWLSVKRRFGLLVVFLLIVYLFASPTYGTNAGGAVAAAISGAYVLLLYSGTRLRLRGLVGIFVALLAILVVMGALNLYLPSGEQTHIGRATHQLLAGQFAELYQLAARKIWLNLTLLRVSAWGKLFVLGLALLLLSLFKQKRQKAKRDLFLVHQNKTVLVTALAAFAFNDSGVVAAALTLLYAIVPIVQGEAALLPSSASADTTEPAPWDTNQAEEESYAP